MQKYTKIQASVQHGLYLFTCEIHSFNSRSSRPHPAPEASHCPGWPPEGFHMVSNSSFLWDSQWKSQVGFMLGAIGGPDPLVESLLPLQAPSWYSSSWGPCWVLKCKNFLNQAPTILKMVENINEFSPRKDHHKPKMRSPMHYPIVDVGESCVILQELACLFLDTLPVECATQ